MTTNSHIIRQRPVLTTILFGLACAVAYIPLGWFLGKVFYWPTALRLMIWTGLAGYTWILTRTSGKPLLAALFPLLFLLAAAVIPIFSIPVTAYGLFALGVLSWVRSGICYPGSVLGRVALELALCVGGALLIGWFGPRTVLEAALMVWLFFLLQSTYFLFAPTPAMQSSPRLDRFEEARRRAERIMASDM